MPVYKYRTFEEARKALWCRNPDKRYFRQLRGLLSIADELCPFRFPQGVFRYRNIQEAKDERIAWEVDFAHKINASRQRAIDADKLP